MSRTLRPVTARRLLVTAAGAGVLTLAAAPAHAPAVAPAAPADRAAAATTSTEPAPTTRSTTAPGQVHGAALGARGLATLGGSGAAPSGDGPGPALDPLVGLVLAGLVAGRALHRTWLVSRPSGGTTRRRGQVPCTWTATDPPPDHHATRHHS